MTIFAERSSVEQVELGETLAPRFDAEGLMPVIVVNADDKMILMLGYMNAEALERTLLTRQAHFWSRSRRALWRKGEHSGFAQRVEHVLIDDDQDALILLVTIDGPGSCHVGFRSCFYREVDCQRRSKSRPFGGVKPGHRVTCRGEWREGVARGPLPPALV